MTSNRARSDGLAGTNTSDAPSATSLTGEASIAASLVFVPPSPSSPLARLDVGRAFPGASHHYRILPTVLRL